MMPLLTGLWPPLSGLWEPLVLGGLLALVVVMVVVLLARIRRLTYALDDLTANVLKALGSLPRPTPVTPSQSEVRYTKKGVPYEWDPVRGSRFVKKAPVPLKTMATATAPQKPVEVTMGGRRHQEEEPEDSSSWDDSGEDG